MDRTARDDLAHGGGRARWHKERAPRRPLAIALLITGAFLVLEVFGALLTNSLALLADAGHMLTDVAALALSLFAVWLARRPATPERSFGYYRAEVLAALANAATLVAISFYIFWEAWGRLSAPPEVASLPMLGIAVAGLGANLASAWVLTRGGGHEHNLNTRGAFLHVVGDVLSSVAAIGAALLMLATGWRLVDPLLSAGIGVLILRGSWRLLSESVDVLLDKAPERIDMAELRDAVSRVDGVTDIHDVHVRTVTSGLVTLSGHVEVDDSRPWPEILLELCSVLCERYGIGHVTLQPEEPSRLPYAFRGCSLDSPAGIGACRAPARPPTPSRGEHAH
jgi:cobalt-zinc-cadmium efflux system protein